jgi:hypothetical protein
VAGQWRVCDTNGTKLEDLAAVAAAKRVVLVRRGEAFVYGAASL